MSKDQTIGATIFVVCAIVGIFYTLTLFYPQWLNTLGIQATQSNVQFCTIAFPVLVAFIAIIGIGAWIGWTMATTPAPKPIEDMTNPKETKRLEDKETKEPKPKPEANFFCVDDHSAPKVLV